MSHPLQLSTSTSTTTTSSRCSSQFPSSSASSALISLNIQAIVELYKQSIGIPNRIVVQKIKEDLTDRKIPHQYYTYALEQTAFAPRPSFQYCQAIIRRLCRERVDPRDLDSLPY